MPAMGSDLRRTQVYLLFALCNIALALAVGAGWFWPVYASYSRTRDAVRLQESRHTLYAGHQSSYEENNLTLARLGAEARWLPYDALTDSLAEITRTGEALGLREAAFTASEPVAHDADGQGQLIFEMRVSAAYEGNAGASLAFVQALGYMAHVRGLRMESIRDEDWFITHLDFSLYGIMPQ
jgi:hypothetical protein